MQRKHNKVAAIRVELMTKEKVNRDVVLVFRGRLWEEEGAGLEPCFYYVKIEAV